MDESNIGQVIVLIAVLGIGAQWLAWRLQWPAIVLLCLFGVLAGPVTGLVVPSRDLGAVVEPVIRLCVAVILFEGGLTLRWHELREAKHGVRRLLFPALPLSWLLGTFAARYIGGLEWAVALVFGAIIVVTGPTVILPLLRQAGLRRRPASYLKWEGIINDPLGALLAVLVFQYFAFAGQGGTLQLLTNLALGAVVAAALGAGAALLLARFLGRGWVPEYLKPPVLLVLVFIVYVAANAVQPEAGLLATTVMGVVLANVRLSDIDELRRFKEYLTILLVSVVFILITADLKAETLTHLSWRALALILAVLFLVRPLAIGLSTIGSDMTWQERLLVGWIAPRGIVAAAVAGVFGPGLVAAGYADGEMLVPLVFALIIATVVLHGFSLGWLARRLGLAAAERRGLLIVGATPWSLELAKTLRELGIQVLMVDSSWHRLRGARLEGIDFFYGEILSEATEARLELSDIGYLLAATDNDAYNTLVCSNFVSLFGRDHVFQLQRAQDEDSKQLAHTLGGRELVGREARYDVLLQRYYQGWRFQKTPITEEFSADDYFSRVNKDAMPFMLVRASRALVLRYGDKVLKPEPGDTMIAFASPAALKAS
ncbi:MAG TPA: sodium:proton antiporter [Gammaproteobacteria bacterium]|nr:sodium:proton antiporter [Gammaproteobacteria bacterium]